jgi:hypothetical protein
MNWLQKLKASDRKTSVERRLPAETIAECPVTEFRREKSEISAPAPFSADDQELIDWFLQAAVSVEPFSLDEARRVSDPVKFFAAIRQEVESRATSPRWRCGATQADLRCLKAVVIKH